MNAKGQALIETIFVIGFVFLLTAKVLQMSYVIWADLVIDREAHKLAICTLQERATTRCEFESSKRLQHLLKLGDIQKLQSQFIFNAKEYSADAKIHWQSSFAQVNSRRRISETEIKKVSRRWR